MHFFSFLNATLPFGGAGQQVRGLVRSDCASFSLEYERPFDLFVVCWMFFFFLLISMFLASGINPCSSWSILDRLVRCVRSCQLFAGYGRKGHCPPRCQRSLTSSAGERCPPQCRLSQRERENQVHVGGPATGGRSEPECDSTEADTLRAWRTHCVRGGRVGAVWEGGACPAGEGRAVELVRSGWPCRWWPLSPVPLPAASLSKWLQDVVLGVQAPPSMSLDGRIKLESGRRAVAIGRAVADRGPETHTLPAAAGAA